MVKVLLLFFFLLLNLQSSQSYKVSLAQLPLSAESLEKGTTVDLIKLLSKVTNTKIDISISPFIRSFNSVLLGESDFHIPLIKNPYISENELEFDYSTAELYTVNFVLYTNTNKKIDINNLGKYNIYTDRAHTNYFGFKVYPITHIESALNMISLDRIDGYIFADVEVDPYIRKMKIKNIKRRLFKTYSVHAVLPKNKKNTEVDKMITKGMKIIKENGQWDLILGKYYGSYVNWQPNNIE